jgi:protoporphyrinogen oxidase
MMGFLDGGTQVLVDAILHALEDAQATLLPATPVARIRIENGRAIGIQAADGREWLFDHVVSAVPLPHFLRMAPDLPEDYRAGLAAIDFVGVVCLVLRLKRKISENFWLNVNDSRVPFNGCIEYTRLNAEMTPDGSTILYVPYYVRRDDERFSRSDADLLAECVRALAVVNPEFREDWIVDWAVSRDPYAQVICPVGFADRIPGHRTPVENLYLIESSQLYPADRSISGTIDLAKKVAGLIDAAASR